LHGFVFDQAGSDLRARRRGLRDLPLNSATRVRGI
jgi:hypothetical protein